MRFYLDIENSSGVRLGPGPITTATRWRHTWRLDRAGEIAAELPASDPRAALLVEKRVVRARARRAGAAEDHGAGIIDRLGLRGGTDVGPLRTLAGNDLLAELAMRTVGFLLISDGAGGATTDALAPIMAFAPAGWALNGATTTAAGVYIQFAGESVLAALGKVAELTGEHFRLDIAGSRAVTWLTTLPTATSLRAVQAGSPAGLETNPNLFLITDLAEERDSYDLFTRIYPYGAGNAAARLTLAATTRTAPAGYTLDLVDNYLKADAAETAYTRIDRHVPFKDIVAAGSTAADGVSAANALFDAALAHLQKRLAIFYAYRLRLAKCDQVLAPGTLLRVVYRKTVDGVTVLNLNQDLLILEATLELDAEGVRTVGVVVATVARWPASDAELLAGGVAQARSMEAHHQPAQSAAAAADFFVADDLTVGDDTAIGGDLNVAGVATFDSSAAVVGDLFAGAVWGAGAGDPVVLGSGLVLPRTHTTTNMTLGDHLLVTADATGGAITITVPDAATVPDGTWYWVTRLNLGANAVTLQRSGTNIINGQTSITLNARYESVLLFGNGSGAWYAFYTAAPSLTAISSDATLSMHHIVTADATGAAITLTIPDAATVPAGHWYWITRLNLGANTVTLQRSGSNIINGATSLTLNARYDSVLLYGNGVGSWFAIQAPATLATGTVTSVAMTGDGVVFNSSVTGSPVTGAGTLAPSLKTQSANRGLFGPTSGGAAAPTFRAAVAADLAAILGTATPLADALAGGAGSGTTASKVDHVHPQLIPPPIDRTSGNSFTIDYGDPSGRQHRVATAVGLGPQAANLPSVATVPDGWQVTITLLDTAFTLSVTADGSDMIRAIGGDVANVDLVLAGQSLTVAAYGGNRWTIIASYGL